MLTTVADAPHCPLDECPCIQTTTLSCNCDVGHSAPSNADPMVDTTGTAVSSSTAVLCTVLDTVLDIDSSPDERIVFGLERIDWLICLVLLYANLESQVIHCSRVSFSFCLYIQQYKCSGNRPPPWGAP